MEKLQREVRLLKAYTTFVTLLLGVFMVAGFARSKQKAEFTEIDVERINIVEKDGKLKMVLSNSERQHPGLFDGKTYSARTRPPGILFFNEKGDECGGLVFKGNQNDGKADAGALLAFDSFSKIRPLASLTRRTKGSMTLLYWCGTGPIHRSAK
jgi:hypothetical protein